MDHIGGSNVNYFSKDQILSKLVSDPKMLGDKKFMELFAGYLVVKMLEEKDMDWMVGFPLKKIKRSSDPSVGPTLDDILNNPKLVDDSDVDIVIGDFANPNRCQVTRLISSAVVATARRDLLDLLSKKFNIQPDEGLTLIVQVEDEITVNETQLRDFLADRNIPYGAIYVTGKVQNKSGAFKCYRIHPDKMESNEFDIGLPL